MRKKAKVAVERVKSKAKKGFSAADNFYVKIPESLFNGLTGLYASVMKDPKPSINADADSALKNIHSSITKNNYAPFVHHCLVEHELTLTGFIEEPKIKLKKHDAILLIRLIRESNQPSSEKLLVFKFLTEDELFNRLKKVYVEHLVPSVVINENSLFNPSEYGSDSLDEVELVMAFEEEFNVEITDQVADVLFQESRDYNLTFANIVSLLKQLPS